MAKKQPSAASKASKPKDSQPSRIPAEFKGLLVLALSLLALLSLASFSQGHPSSNLLGLAGYTFSWLFLYLVGVGSYLVILFTGWIGWRLLISDPPQHLVAKTIYFLIFLFSACLLLNVASQSFPSFGAFFSKLTYVETTILRNPRLYEKLRVNVGGVPLFYLYTDMPFINLKTLLSNPGTAIVFSTFLSLSFILLVGINPLTLFRKSLPEDQELEKKPSFIKAVFKKLISFIKQDLEPKIREVEASLASINISQEPKPLPAEDMPVSPTPLKRVESSTLQAPPLQIKVATRPKEIADDRLSQRPAEFKPAPSGYELPPLNLLSQATPPDLSTVKKDLQNQAKQLEETLMSFGIEAKVGEINCGPTITSFEVHPAIGVKVQRIKTLSDDIALNLQAKSIRILAPIPGKAAVGIEVPNLRSSEVSFREMLAAYQKTTNRYQIPVLLGKTVTGETVSSDLAKMPHCIVAGATGSGKSVCINTIIMAILMTMRPDEIKFIMIDPKKVELTPYNNLPHMLAPVITDPHTAHTALIWLVKEMERRYELFKQLGCRNIVAFNHRHPDEELEKSLGKEVPKTLPYILCIIDELADLMMSSTSDIETPIARIAQMARAVGIHMIVATQRPSREVITGLIKANFPTRIAFKVSSRINSQIILDDVGAETLLGNGDMLFLPPGSSFLMRAQGAYVRDEDISKVIKFITKQMPANYLINSFDELKAKESGLDALGANDDTLYEEAKNIVLETGNASTTFLQRKLKIGYARAASLMDLLESKKIVGPAEGSKPRRILIERDDAE